VQSGSHGGGFFDNEAELIAAIERDVGPEAAEEVRRSRRLAANPRPLTDAERADLRAALEPVLRDLRNTGAIVPDILEEAHDDLGPDYVCAWIQTPAGVGSQGIRVQVSLPVPERLAEMVGGVDLAELCITSAGTIRLEPPPADAFALPDVPEIGVRVTAALGERCERCWRVLPEVGHVAAHPDLCRRCAAVVGPGGA